MTKVSIITISYNQIEYLPRCLASVRAQAGPYEHIVVDPGSSDGSRDFLKSFDDARLKLVFRPDNGPAQGLNHGLEICSGDIVIYINADDELAPRALDNLRASHSRQPDADVVVNDGWIIDDFDRPIRYFRSSRLTRIRAALNIAVVLQQGTSFKASSLKGRFWFNEFNRLDWDGELVWSMLRSGARIGYSHEETAYFRWQAKSITFNRELQAALRSSHRAKARINAGPYWSARVLSWPARLVWKSWTTLVGLNKDFPGMTSRPVGVAEWGSPK